MAKFDTMIFDLDGTLLDTLPDLVHLTNTVLREHGFPEHTTAEIRSYVGNGARALMHQAVPEGTPQEVADELLTYWKEAFFRCSTVFTRAYPGVEEALKELEAAGVKLGVLSNKFDAGVQFVIKHYLPSYFSAIHGEGGQFPRKPDPAGLLRCIDEMSSTPERTIYVGDSPGDIVAAHNANCFALGVAWGYHSAEELKEAHADAVIYKPAEFLQFVRE